MKLSRHLARRLWVTALLAMPLTLMAQAFPARPISLIVPQPARRPGGHVARLVGDSLAKVVGQSVVIEITDCHREAETAKAHRG